MSYVFAFVHPSVYPNFASKQMLKQRRAKLIDPLQESIPEFTRLSSDRNILLLRDLQEFQYVYGTKLVCANV